MNQPLRLIPLAICCLTASAAAQNAAPVSDALRSTAQRDSRHLVAAAEEMPAGKYGFKPTPSQMSFGDVIAHLSNGNDYLCSTVSGVTAPKRSSEATGGLPKNKLVSRLKESFQFCQSALAKLDDSKLAEKLPFFGDRKLSRAQVMFATAQDWADHYSQLANYLRLNGLLPPTAKEKEE
ncbi:MAG: DinB family protein [Gemmatimonadales bacterium]